ncbi:MAG: hypothetical protein LCH52_05585 [Bacteroidetes bacterium]|nr:hypothetical protein [Bacteroidota bacterium]
MDILPEQKVVKSIWSFIWWLFQNRKMLYSFTNLLTNVHERMLKIELLQNDPGYHCTNCRTETRVLLATRYIKDQLTGIYYCTVCERVSERPALEKVILQNAETMEIINKLKERGCNFEDTGSKKVSINRPNDQRWDSNPLNR